MKKFLMFLVCALACACGGAPDDAALVQDNGFTFAPIPGSEVSDAPAHADAEFGQAAQAQSAPANWPSGYGSIPGASGNPTYGNDVPCRPSATLNSFGACDVPTHKRLYLNRTGADYAFSGQGQQVSMGDLFTDACNWMHSQLSLKGWDIRCNSTGPNGYTVNYSFCDTSKGQCKYVPSNPSAVGVTHEDAYGSDFPLPGNPGVFGQYVTRYVIEIPVDHIATYFNNLTPRQTFASEEWMIENSELHELYHSAGLAHNATDGTLMFKDTGCPGPLCLGIGSPTSTEYSWLQNWAPGS